MSKLFFKFNLFSRKVFPRFNSQLAEKNDKSLKYVDENRKLVYGGDLPIPISEKSVGRILFDRLRQKEREDEIFQICTKTQAKLTTKKYVERAVAMAERLRENGVQKGDLVFLIGSNSINMNISVFGVFISGAVPFPLSHKTSLDDFNVLMNKVRPKFIGCDSRFLFIFKRTLQEHSFYDPSKIFLLNATRDFLENQFESFDEFISGKGENVDSFVPSEVTEPKEELALVISPVMEDSSGKGVGITHHNINSVIARYDAKDRKKLGTSVILMVQKITWISGFYAFLLGCCFGSKIVIMNEFDEETFLKAIQEHKVTSTYIFLPKLWQLYKYEVKENYDLSSCKYLYYTDGEYSQNLVDGMKEKFGLSVQPSYARSEFTGLVLKSFCKFKQGSVGKLVPQFYAKVVSEKSNQKVGPNEKGEICFKGPSVMKGYVDNPDATKQSFDKEGFFLSGTYGYYDPDGNFFILDKISHVIMYKDFKIAPVELENIIKSLDAVKDVIVAGVRHATDGFYPIAFVSLQKGKKITEKDVWKYVNERVPSSKKLRGGVIFIPKIPKSKETGAPKRRFLNKILSNYEVISEAKLDIMEDRFITSKFVKTDGSKSTNESSKDPKVT